MQLQPNEWTNWYQHTDNPRLIEQTGVRGRWIYWRVAPRGDANPDQNYLLVRNVFVDGRDHYPDENAEFCGVCIDGFHYRTRHDFVDKMRPICKGPVRYTWAMRIADLFRWADIPLQRRRRFQQRLAALPEVAEFDLLELFRKGFVRARATGQSITRIDAEAENLSARRFRIVVAPGTYFVSAGGHQNMVARAPRRFVLEPRAVERFSVEASCINASLPIPGDSDKFRGVAKVPDNVVRFLEAASGSDAMVVQAGVWALTDGYSGARVQRHLVGRDRFGNSRQVVTDQHLAEARQILNRLGIRHAL